ncbi:331_t:CDS:2 [Diversispora eburnea]|uniref:331_t:CDS:1 n=1 Tax=Diversispora eburnea TaxID=1213867 RepID=A0A9N8ZWU9_9GLOM|nr:331_t:CDS:2 [Diversispora eburnea]
MKKGRKYWVQGNVRTLLDNGGDYSGNKDYFPFPKTCGPFRKVGDQHDHYLSLLMLRSESRLHSKLTVTNLAVETMFLVFWINDLIMASAITYYGKLLSKLSKQRMTLAENEIELRQIKRQFKVHLQNVIFFKSLKKS